MKEKLLIVVDYQNDFVNGSLGFDGAEKIEKFIIDKINEYKKEKQDVIFTLDTHLDNYLETIEGKNLPIKHCILNTDGHKLYGKINELSKPYKKINKYTFGSDKLGFYLKFHKYKEIELVGLVSNICVISNAIIAKSFSPNSIIRVYKEGVGSPDLDMQNKAFDILKNLHIEII